MMREVRLALGSNLGDREKNVRVAVSKLNSYFGTSPSAASPLMETKAVGFSGPDFINCVVSYLSDEDPFVILSWCKEVEREMGRREIIEYDAFGNRIFHDRVIDVDILTVGDLEINDPNLLLPHPQLKSRSYISELLLNLQDLDKSEYYQE